MKRMVLPQLPISTGPSPAALVDRRISQPAPDSPVSDMMLAPGSAHLPHQSVMKTTPGSLHKSPQSLGEDRPLNIGRGGADMFTEPPETQVAELETTEQLRSQPGLQQLVELFGDEIGRQLVSRERHWRETGAKALLVWLGSHPSSVQVVVAVAEVAVRLLRERAVALVLSAMPLVGELAALHSPEVQEALSGVVLGLLQRSLDTNQRVGKEATESAAAFLQRPATADLLLTQLAHSLAAVGKGPKLLHARIVSLKTLLKKSQPDHRQRFVGIALQTAELGLADKDLSCREASFSLVVDCLLMTGTRKVEDWGELQGLPQGQKKRIEDALAAQQSK
eukprot:TRINITY_DN12668_c0_g2_i2.p1 TRINITY_DN12668_c0_g2~~TRINITY_DN12668_c0_g2_i2.p1  ORF type:complete len:336 (+),score=76.64 TRINITY_DN12668_c0_g2_i2:946-1953(+)